MPRRFRGVAALTDLRHSSWVVRLKAKGRSRRRRCIPAFRVAREARIVGVLASTPRVVVYFDIQQHCARAQMARRGGEDPG